MAVKAIQQGSDVWSFDESEAPKPSVPVKGHVQPPRDAQGKISMARHLLIEAAIDMSHDGRLADDLMYAIDDTLARYDRERYLGM